MRGETKKAKSIKVDQLLIGLAGLVCGTIVGASMMVLVDANSNNTPFDPTKANIFREGKPAVMRVYKPLGQDQIFVDNNNDGRYSKLDVYLNSISNKAERDIEEIKIKKLVGLYK